MKEVLVSTRRTAALTARRAYRKSRSSAAASCRSVGQDGGDGRADQRARIAGDAAEHEAGGFGQRGERPGERGGGLVVDRQRGRGRDLVGRIRRLEVAHLPDGEGEAEAGGDRGDGLGVVQAGAAQDRAGQLGRLAAGERSQGDAAVRIEADQHVAGGDQDRRLLGGGQQRTDLCGGVGVVQDDQHPLAGGRGPPGAAERLNVGRARVRRHVQGVEQRKQCRGARHP
ncbi:hypothetical protein [Nonomuraea sp. NPDC049607]|uniref:hypothetical protein n=1 Tax=Nonomuraea sp. NPDC049607 TaxID=3154732 RepID=UPI003444E51B